MHFQYIPVLQRLLLQSYPQHTRDSAKTVVISRIRFQKLAVQTQKIIQLDFPSLTTLVINHCDLRTLENMPIVPTLVNLDVSNNSLQGSFEFLVRNRKIQYLNASHNFISRLQVLAPLRRLKNLQVFLKDNQVCQKEGFTAKIKQYKLKLLKQPKQIKIQMPVLCSKDGQIKQKKEDLNNNNFNNNNNNSSNGKSSDSINGRIQDPRARSIRQTERKRFEERIQRRHIRRYNEQQRLRNEMNRQSGQPGSLRLSSHLMGQPLLMLGGQGFPPSRPSLPSNVVARNIPPHIRNPFVGGDIALMSSPISSADYPFIMRNARERGHPVIRNEGPNRRTNSSSLSSGNNVNESINRPRPEATNLVIERIHSSSSSSEPLVSRILPINSSQQQLASGRIFTLVQSQQADSDQDDEDLDNNEEDEDENELLGDEEELEDDELQEESENQLLQINRRTEQNMYRRIIVPGDEEDDGLGQFQQEDEVLGMELQGLQQLEEILREERQMTERAIVRNRRGNQERPLTLPQADEDQGEVELRYFVDRDQQDKDEQQS